MSVESPIGVEQVFWAFGSRDYWTARLSAFGGGTAALDSLDLDNGGHVTVVVKLSLLRERLPRMVTQLHRGDLAMIRSERWYRIAEGRVRGDITASVPGAPFSAAGEALLAPTPNGSRLDYTTTVAVRIPLVGGKIESYIGNQASQEIAALQRFTTEWITDND